MIKHIFKLIWNKKGKNGLLILEIFLSFLVLFAVMTYVMYNTDRLSLPLGFETENKWMLYLDNTDDMDSVAVAEMKINLKTALEELAPIKSVGFSNSVSPFGYSTWQSSDDEQGFEIESRYVYADIGFAKTMGINLLDGRWFEEKDLSAKYKPMIVNQRFIKEYFPGLDMIDSIIQFNGEKKIVGIIDDYRYNGIFEEERNTSFFLQPFTEKRATTAYLDLEEGTSIIFEEEVNQVVEQITKSSKFVIRNLAVLEDRNAKETWVPIIAILSISAFLCINVALGLFGVLWYTINKRRSEIGLRRALGAHTTDIASQFAIEILLLTGMAILAGIFFAIQVPLLEILPLENDLYFRAIIYSALIILAIVGLCALYPSNQAAKIHPAIALHED